MPKKYYKIRISEEAEIHIFFETANGLIISFMVKLILITDGALYEILRFDSAHQCPHKDILGVDGTVRRKIWYRFLDNKQALDLAISDLKENADLYIGRFKKWLKK